jgi:hypothetical protein
MRIYGPLPLECNETGRLKSQIGTVFLSPPGLVTRGNMHFMQRMDWIAERNRERVALGLPALSETDAQEEAENHSVDLLFAPKTVLIRPNPARMDLAFEADELLQELVPKRDIRYLNTQDGRVRDALRARGENWRMSRLPVSPEEMEHLIAASRVAIGSAPLYFYNHSTGTRFLTFGSFAWIGQQPPQAFREMLREIADFSAKRNRFHNPEIDVFPPACPFSRASFAPLGNDALTDDERRALYERLLAEFQAAVPAALKDETTLNTEWRNALCAALTQQSNAVDADDLIQGLAPEFYRQIEWLPGCSILRGELLFDPASEAPDADTRARAIIFNYLREGGIVEHINIGRIGRSLSMRHTGHARRANVYIVQIKEKERPAPELRILRFQKWGVIEHLDQDKDFLRAIVESRDYTDYVLDRRLACRQLGMTIAGHIHTGRISETYHGLNPDPKLQGRCFWSVYFERPYVSGCATDKLPQILYADPLSSLRFAALLGEAAAVNCIVGRAGLDNLVLFDDGDEVLQFGPDGLPERLVVSDHTGAFAQYLLPLICNARAYADPVNHRAPFIPNAAEFAEQYLAAFQKRFDEVQQEYRRHHHAFDILFNLRDIEDPNGNIRYRWRRVLERLDSTDSGELTQTVRSHIKVLAP